VSSVNGETGDVVLDLSAVEDIDNRLAAKMDAGIAGLPAGSTLTVAKSGGTWPARPTPRSDIIVWWKGADPSPAIVSSGTGGMRDNVDMRAVTP